MLRLSKTTFGHVGQKFTTKFVVKFAVSVSALMLVVASSPATAKVVHGVKPHGAHASKAEPAKPSEPNVAQTTGDTQSSSPNEPTVSAREGDKADERPVPAELTNSPATEPADAAQNPSPETAVKSDSGSNSGGASSGDENTATPSAPSEQTAGTSEAPASATAPTPESAKAPAPATEPASASNQKADESKSAKDSTAESAPSIYATAKRKYVPRAPNPIAAAQPNMDVVVCEAGCTNASETQEAVYVQPTTASDRVATISEVTPNSAGQPASNVNRENTIVCLGGCYDTPKSYPSALANANVSAGSWTANVVPTNAKSTDTGSGDWMRRIDAGRDAKPATSDNTKAEKK